MFDGHDEAVAALLRDSGLLPLETLAALRDECHITGESLAGTIVDRGFVEEPKLLRCVAEYLGLDYIETPPVALPDEIASLVPGELARRYAVVPWSLDGSCLNFLAVDPFKNGVAGELTFALGRDVRLVVAAPARVMDLFRKYYDQLSPNSVNQAGRTAAAPPPDQRGQEFAETDLHRMAGQAGAVRFVNLVLSQATRERASDIHFEPFEDEFRVRWRIDGTLHGAPLPAPPAMAVISRLKVLAGLNIAERRVPQDGRIRIDVDGRSVDLRISTLPTQFGESVVLRVLDRSATPLKLAELGMSREVEAGLQDIVRRPNGILLVTGPTGSGKTTTLYSCLRIINQPELKILTAEDPVEYEIGGIMQLPVNPAIGLTFATALRSFLRQDPDVLMVGEIRDLETAQIAIQAALTGHLVLSTLHTNDAAGAITRLVDMGVEPYLLCSTLEAVLAQRLVRRICPDCREAAEASAVGSVPADLDSAANAGPRAYRGRGCEACQHRGFRGRTGIFEWLRMSEPLRELVTRRAPALAIKEMAVAHGMQTLRTAARRAALDGVTTWQEAASHLR